MGGSAANGAADDENAVAWAPGPEGVLLVKNRRRNGRHDWSPPGGVIDDTDPSARDAALRGIDYVLAAQYRNGGWPQFFPLRDDYSRHITFNDGAMIGVMTLLDDLVKEPQAWGFVDEARRAISSS